MNPGLKSGIPLGFDSVSELKIRAETEPQSGRERNAKLGKQMADSELDRASTPTVFSLNLGGESVPLLGKHRKRRRILTPKRFLQTH
jgi:hypothetical protein